MPPCAQQRSADAHQVRRRARVGERQMRIALRGRPRQRALIVRLRGSGPGSAECRAVDGVARAGTSAQRSTRYGFASSNARAWRSTNASAWSVVSSRVSRIRLATRPK